MNPLDEDNNTFDELKDRLAQSEDYTEPVGAGKRLANYIIDSIVWYMIALIILIAIVYITKDETLLDNKFFGYLITFTAVLAYYIFFEGLTGQTIGKMITKTKVVNELGNKPTLSQVVGRSFARLIPFDAFTFIGGGSGWHDSLAGTKVVSAVSKNIDELV